MTKREDSQPKAVLFDLDGTLIDALPVLRLTYHSFLKEFGRLSTDLEFESLNGPSLKEIVAILRHRHGLDPDSEQLFERYFDLLRDCYMNVLTMEGADSLLHALQAANVRLGLVTSAPRLIVETILDRKNWSSYFASVVTCDDVVWTKPHPESYICSLTQLKVVGSSALAIEDSVNGVSAAAAAGVPVLGLGASYGSERLIHAGALQVISGLPEAHRALVALNIL